MPMQSLRPAAQPQIGAVGSAPPPPVPAPPVPLDEAAPPVPLDEVAPPAPDEMDVLEEVTPALLAAPPAPWPALPVLPVVGPPPVPPPWPLEQAVASAPPRMSEHVILVDGRSAGRSTS